MSATAYVTFMPGRRFPNSALTLAGGISSVMTARSPAHRRLLLVLMFAGLGGFAGLIALSTRFGSAHVPLHADLIRFFALVWLMVFGAARILVHLDQALYDEDPDTDHWSRLRGRGDL